MWLCLTVSPALYAAIAFLVVKCPWATLVGLGVVVTTIVARLGWLKVNAFIADIDAALAVER